MKGYVAFVKEFILWIVGTLFGLEVFALFSWIMVIVADALDLAQAQHMMFIVAVTLTVFVLAFWFLLFLAVALSKEDD